MIVIKEDLERIKEIKEEIEEECRRRFFHKHVDKPFPDDYGLTERKVPITIQPGDTHGGPSGGYGLSLQKVRKIVEEAWAITQNELAVRRLREHPELLQSKSAEAEYGRPYSVTDRMLMDAVIAGVRSIARKMLPETEAHEQVDENYFAVKVYEEIRYQLQACLAEVADAAAAEGEETEEEPKEGDD